MFSALPSKADLRRACALNALLRRAVGREFALAPTWWPLHKVDAFHLERRRRATPMACTAARRAAHCAAATIRLCLPWRVAAGTAPRQREKRVAAAVV